MRIKILLVFIFFNLILNAQNETKHWCFNHGQHLVFNSNNIEAIANCSIKTSEAAASISDSDGNLLFYTNGETVWNKLDQVMAKGENLFGDYSTSQTLIVKQPLSDSKYYIFYAPGWGGNPGASYAIVDMSLNNGLGEVISKNNLLFADSSEKFTATTHANGKDKWIMTRSVLPVFFRAYLLTDSGLNLTPVISTDGTKDTTGIGYMKFSHNGSLLANAISDLQVYELLDFNKETGELSNPRFSPVFPTNSNYGVEFSPNDSILYVTKSVPPLIAKYDLTIPGNPLTNYTVVSEPNCFSVGSLQLAIDGNIYVAWDADIFDDGYLGAIHYPNSWKSSVYNENEILLTNSGSWSLPNYDQSLLANVKNNIPTSLIEVKNDKEITVFPNPFQEEIQLKSSFEFTDISIRDIIGREVFKAAIPKTYNYIADLKNFSNGIYFITISSRNKSSTVKIVRGDY